MGTPVPIAVQASSPRSEPWAETSHPKCLTKPDGSLDTDDFRRALRAVTASGFTGPLCLVYDAHAPDEWAGLATCRRATGDLPGY